jgi:hypothetical protein
MWRMMCRRTKRDEGAIGVLVAIVVVIVLLPLAAIAIDAGGIWAERRQQQNGADAGALAVGQTCVEGTCDGGTGPSSTAGNLADSNSNDNTTQVDLVCGTATGLSPCPAATGERWDCPPAAGSVPYVQVYTSVLTSDNKHLLPTWFGRVVLGSSFNGAAVKSCARAAFGPPGSLTSALPLTISKCEWLKYTNDDTSYAPLPPYGSPPTYPVSFWHTIYFHDTTGASDCPAGPSGADLPGGFGWLQTSTGCQTATSIDNWYNDSTGRPPPNSCTWQMLQQMQGQIVYVPIFNNTNGLTGSNGQYYVAGYAGFFLSGYSIEGQYMARDLATGQYPCSGSQSCISGWFTSGLAPATATGGSGEEYGVEVVSLTG